MNTKIDIKRYFIIFFISGFIANPITAAESAAIKKIAKYIVEKCSTKNKSKVVILPFISLDEKNQSIGDIISEDILVQVVGFDQVNVVERSQVDKLLGELAFNQSGAIDAENAKKIGRGLGADAIIIGSYRESKNMLMPNALKINVKITDTETFEIIGATQAEINNEWKQKEKKTAAEENNDYQSQKRYQPSRSEWISYDIGLLSGFSMKSAVSDLYLEGDILSGQQATIMSVSQEFEVPPIIFKSNLWSSAIFGFGFDMGYMVSRFADQTVDVSGNLLGTSTITFSPANTYKVSTLLFNFSMLVRIPLSTQFFPYAAVIYPMKYTWVEYSGNENDPLQLNGAYTFGMGGLDLMSGAAFDIFKMFSYAIGVQWNIVKNLGFVAEYQMMNVPASNFYSTYTANLPVTTYHMVNFAVMLRM